MADFTLAFAFLAGLVSFLSPCVLPIIPGFLAYLAGTAGAGKGKRHLLLFHSALFVLGFSLVFAVLGVLLNSVLSHSAYDVQTWLSRVGGLLIIFFGLHLTGLIEIPFLQSTHSVKINSPVSSRPLASLLFGAAFAVGWTPCVGAVLGSILALAASQPASAFPLLLSYSLGLGIPFLLAGAFADRFSGALFSHAHALEWLTRAFGVVLIALGILVFTQTLTLVANLGFLNQWLLKG